MMGKICSFIRRRRRRSYDSGDVPFMANQNSPNSSYCTLSSSLTLSSCFFLLLRHFSIININYFFLLYIFITTLFYIYTCSSYYFTSFPSKLKAILDYLITPFLSLDFILYRSNKY